MRNSLKLKRAVEEAGVEFGKIDLLVNNAGIIRKIDFTKITERLLDEFISVNLKSALFASQYCLKYLRKSKSPLIINIASLGGIQNWSNYIPYGVSKAGLVKLTYLLAKRLAPRIRVNAIAPGTIIINGEETKMTEKTPISKIPLQSYGSPRDITEAVKYLINSPYVTGQVIAVEGGRLLF